MIRAAGGLVWRPGPDGQRLVCLVHRPRHDDWSLPKGKLTPGEHPLAAAVREVREETGVEAVPQLPLPSSRYRPDDAPDQDKVVDFWAMAVRGGIPRRAPDSEVDRVIWLPETEAVARLSYRQDRDLVAYWRSLPPVSAVVLLVRHAEAGSRLSDPDRDRHRPLSTRGTADAATLCATVALFAPERLVSATPLRCRQTLAPLSARVELEPVFDEAGGDPVAAVARLRTLAETGSVTVVCSQGKLLSAVLAALADADRPQLHHDDAGRSVSWETAKGDGWSLTFSGPRLVALAPLRLKN